MTTSGRTALFAAGLAAAVAGSLLAAGPAQAATACSVTYAVSNSWSVGFQGAITVRNTGSAWTSWSLTFAFPAGQSAVQGWGGTWTTGTSPSVANASYNGSVATGGSVDLGFIGSGSGAGSAPASFSINGTTCDGGTVPTASPTSSSGPTTTAPPPPTTSRPPTTSPPATTTPASTRPATTTPPVTTAQPARQPFKGVANSACADIPRLNASWWYDWYISPQGCTAPNFVPMVSGKGNHSAGDIAWARDQAINAGYKTLLGFNEPNKADQSNLSVATAVSLWPTLTSDASVRIGSPATSADGQAWFTSFMAQVAAKNLRVDFIALHWYGWNAGSCDAQASQLESYIRWAEAFPGNRPIWITELGCMNLSAPSAASVRTFYAGVRTMLARHPRVERYAWYPWNVNNELVAANGTLTPLGSDLAAAPAARTP